MEFYSIKEVQQMLKISKNTAYELFRRDDFPALKVGGQYRISKDEFKKWCDRKAYKE